MKTYIHADTCTGMFIAALFRTADNWKQPECASGGKWLNNPSTGHVLAIKRHELHARTHTHTHTYAHPRTIICTNLQRITLSVKHH